MRTFPYPLLLQRLTTVLAIVTLTLTAIAASSGILIAFYYEPTAGGAYNSIREIATGIPFGNLVLSLHNIAGNFLIGAALVQMVAMFLGRQYNRAWLTGWISGILLILSAIGASWTAALLGWTQEGYWRFRIELGTIEAIPVIGSTLRYLLTGGDAVNTTTVQHLYTLHSYLLSIGAVGLAIAHLVAVFLAARQPLEIPENQSFNLDSRAT